MRTTDRKIRTCITGIMVNGPTYRDVPIKPSMINFFYGKNGTGKSTLAKAFKDGNAALAWDGDPYPESRILIYNEQFIEDNVQSYGNIPGVFTISKANAEKKKEADSKLEEKRLKDSAIGEKEKKIKGLSGEQAQAYDAHIAAIWKTTEPFRREYGPALTYLRDRKKFVEKMEGYQPAQVQADDVKKLFDTVYGKAEAAAFQEYRPITPATLPDSPLLGKPILSSGSTEFASFVRAVGSLDWITKGHEEYHGTAGCRCPFCGQALPDSFEEDLASCYDGQYRKDKAELDSFTQQYRDAMNAAAHIVSANQANPWATAHAGDYAAKYELFLEKGKANMALLHQKQENPSCTIELEDLSPLLLDLNTIAGQINAEIRKHNAVIADIPNQKTKCSDLLWGQMAYDCRDEIKSYREQAKKRDDMIETLGKEIRKLKEESGKLAAEAAKLNSETVNTTAAMHEINRSIRNAGFRGFFLQEKPGAKYVYQLVRNVNGKNEVVDKNLSEGERHFIAFLYFYHTVMGSQSDEGRVEDKIVVIDDPVSSMDSGTIFVVAALTREMIAVCYNNYLLDAENRDDHIKQFFCMTHNPYYFREITYNRLSDYECASFFEITKDGNNLTSINEKYEKSTLTGGGDVNVSPVRSSYDALWHEYCTTDDPETLMVVIRQILEYYFVQMVGYQNVDLRRDLLDKNEKEFVKTMEDGSENRDDYVAAAAMIAMINVGATGFNDGLYYDSSAADVGQLRAVFEKIFKVMNSEQHYNMMTKRTK